MESKVKEAEVRRGWLSIAQLAAEFGVSEKTLYRVIAAGRFPAVRISEGRIAVPARVLDELAERALATGRLVDAADWAEAQE